MKIAVNVAGHAEVMKALSAIPQHLRRTELTNILLEAGEPLRSRVAQLAPRSDEAPHIADHIGMNAVRSVDGVKLREDQAAVAVGPLKGRASGKRFKGFFYGWMLEYGTVKMPAQPFLRPAWDSEQSRTQDRIRSGLLRALRPRSTSGRGL